jgi:hypothetical protein
MNKKPIGDIGPIEVTQGENGAVAHWRKIGFPTDKVGQEQFVTRLFVSALERQEARKFAIEKLPEADHDALLTSNGTKIDLQLMEIVIRPNRGSPYQSSPKEYNADKFAEYVIRAVKTQGIMPFVPMTTKFFEAAKEGEYERNLRILAAFLRGELEQEEPDASNFARMARRVEGMSLTDLKVLAMIEAFLSTNTNSFLQVGGHKRPFVSATALTGSAHNKHSLSQIEIQEALVDLVSRGFLMADGASRLDKHEEYYFASSSLDELMGRAREQVMSAA